LFRHWILELGFSFVIRISSFVIDALSVHCKYNTMTRVPSIRKAAVLIASLDADTADLLLGQMSAKQAEAVRREVVELNNIGPDEQQSVIDEFFRIGPLVPEHDPPGLDLDEYLSKRVALPIDEYLPTHAVEIEPLENARPKLSKHESLPNRTHQPFSFLQDSEPGALVPFLEREHPQAIALVLSHLPPQRASHVLARLPATLQADVVRRLVDLEETDPHVVQEVEQAVEAWLRKRQPLRRRVAGEAAVSAILNSAEGSARRQILNNLALHDRPLAHRFTPPQPTPRRFTFKQLCNLPIDALVAVVRLSDERSSILALAGTAAEVVDGLLDRLRPDEAERISHSLAHLGPMRLADIDRAQESLAELASHLHAEGRLPSVDITHLTAVV
jgi:flagellar motor switch protein FliG